ncbi:hypothetical protein Bsph_2911 [Lysinibacillus sphaericus C3-41]|uniref:Uncharacterized protein n=1 Tax=Lysinibacillus sphaericus (strain C3-41) TaxID=444177 RepID=B1HND0_LYSSC|nr:hypothetical protein Bsph_2911 [Lysinibacillus sphaericus C3-41]
MSHRSLKQYCLSHKKAVAVYTKSYGYASLDEIKEGIFQSVINKIQ